MLNSGKKIRATTKINILTLVLSEIKNHNPPLQVKWSVPKHYSFKQKNTVAHLH